MNATESPTKRPDDEDTAAASVVTEEIQTVPREAYEHATSLVDKINELTVTNSTAETLELTARLLGELGVAVASLSLDRGGFVTSAKSSLTSAHDAQSAGKDTSISVRAGAAEIEARFGAGLTPHTKRAAGALLKAATIQIERCSRRPWQFAPPEQAGAKSRKLEADIQRVARFPHGILITGETGTGKTLSARQIHAKSVRSSAPFVELNCAALPEHLVEAELFGYRKGAYTGADRDHKGMFEEADSGILFLDEVGDLPLAVQNKLLKAIDEKQVKRLGTNNYVSCDVQILAATSRDLREMIRRGEFREDLYCRLAVLKIEVAPLRERREEIPALIAHFLREAAESVSKSSGRFEEYGIETGAIELMCAFEWAGNIRVLRNTIFELTSYVRDGELITLERVQSALVNLGDQQTKAAASNMPNDSSNHTVTSRNTSTLAEIEVALRKIAQDGDIVLPVQVCLLRRGETLRQWAARVKQLGIEATCRANDAGTMREAATRLGLSHGSLKGHLHRARCAS